MMQAHLPHEAPGVSTVAIIPELRARPRRRSCATSGTGAATTRRASRQSRPPCRGSRPRCPRCARERWRAGARGGSAARDLRRRRARAVLPRVRSGRRRPRRARLPARDPEPRRLVRRDRRGARAARLRRLPPGPARLRREPRAARATSRIRHSSSRTSRRFVELARREHPEAPIVLVGGCWGARPALAYATEYPYELAGLALIGPGAEGEGRPRRRPRSCAVFRGRLREPDRPIRIPLEAEMFTANPAVPRVHPRGPALAARGHGRASTSSSSSGTGGCSRRDELAMPVLLLQAGRDPIVDGERCQAAGSSSSGAPAKRYLRYPEFGHILDFEPERERYWDDLSAWLDEVVSEPRRRAPCRPAHGVRRRSRPAHRRASVPLLVRPRARRPAARRRTWSRGSCSTTAPIGYGECVPREYVTGETVETALAALTERTGAGPARARPDLGRRARRRDRRGGTAGRPRRAPRDRRAVRARARAPRRRSAAGSASPVQAWLGGEAAKQVRYDAVLPFSSPRKVAILARVIKAYGIGQVKVKVGDDLERELETLAILRRLLGPAVDLRVDANCGWTADEALDAIERMRAYGISAIEQPIAADDLAGLARLTAELPRDDHRRRVAAHGRGRRADRRGAGLQRLQHPRLQVRRPARIDGDRPDRAVSRARPDRRRPGRRERAALGRRPPSRGGDRLAALPRGLRRQPAPEGGPDRRARRCQDTAAGRARPTARGSASPSSPRCSSVTRPRARRSRRRRDVGFAARHEGHLDRPAPAPDVARLQRRAPLRRGNARRARGAGALPARRSPSATPTPPTAASTASPKIRSIDDFRARGARRTPTSRSSPTSSARSRGEKHVLTADDPLMFATTSGTTGKAKYIPVTSSYMHEYSHGVHVHLYRILNDFGHLMDGKFLVPDLERRRGPLRRRTPLRRDLRVPGAAAARRDQALLRAPVRALQGEGRRGQVLPHAPPRADVGHPADHDAEPVEHGHPRREAAPSTPRS